MAEIMKFRTPDKQKLRDASREAGRMIDLRMSAPARAGGI